MNCWKTCICFYFNTWFLLCVCLSSFGSRTIPPHLHASGFDKHYGVKSQNRKLYYLLGKDTFTVRKMLQSLAFSYFETCSVYWPGLYETG